MSTLLIIISGVLGILGVLFNLSYDVKIESKSVRPEPKLTKRLSWIGGLFIALIICSSIITIYLNYSTQLENERLNDENMYLELSNHHLGPNYIFSASLNQNVLSKKPGEAARDFFDIESRYSIFQNLGDTQNYVAVTIKHGNVNFSLLTHGNGRVDNYLYLENYDSFLLNSGGSLEMPVKGRGYFDYSSNHFSCNGTLDTLVRAGTVYGRLLKDYRENSHPSYIRLFFKERPNEELTKKSISRVRMIEKVSVAFSFDINAIRWFIVVFKLDDTYSLEKNGDWWELTIKLIMNESPKITDLYKSNKEQFDLY